MREYFLRRNPSFEPRWRHVLVALVASGALVFVSCQSDDTSRPLAVSDVETVGPTPEPTPSAPEPTPTVADSKSVMGSSRAPLPSTAPRRQIIEVAPSATPTPSATATATPPSRNRSAADRIDREVEVLPSASAGSETAWSPESARQPFVQSDGLGDDAEVDDAEVDDAEIDSISDDGVTTASEQPPAGDESADLDTNAIAVRTANGYLLPAVAADDDTWIVTTPCGDQAELREVTPVSAPQVLLDPGHGGDEPGSATPDGIAEKDLNLRVARRVRRHLEEANISVAMLRDNDIRITVPVRSAIANALKPDLFVSIHHNGGATDESDEPSVEVFHQHNSSDAKRLAGLLFEAIDAELSTFSYRWPTNSFSGAQPRFNGEGDDLYGVLRRSVVPAVLTEAFYLDGSAGDAIASNPQVLEAEAQAIASSIIRYLETDDFGSGFRKGQEMTLASPGSGGASGCVDPVLE